MLALCITTQVIILVSFVEVDKNIESDRFASID